MAVSTVSRCDGVIEGFGGAIEVATELGDFGGVKEVFDGAIGGAAVSYRRCQEGATVL